MKALVFNMLTIAATFAAMTACTSESDPVDEVNPHSKEKVEIKLKTGVIDVTTKAESENGPISSTDNKQFANDTPIQLIRWDHSGDLTNLTWTEGSYSQVSAKASGTAITFDEDQYYTTDGKSTSFIGFYPAIDGSSVTLSSGTVQFTGLTGKLDILSAKLVNVGNQADPKKEAIQFDHMLSQVKIKLSGTTEADELFGKITKITLADVPNNINMTFGIKETAIAIPDKNSKADISVMTSTEGSLITSLKETYTILVPPSLGTSGNDITIKIETTEHGTENPLTIPISNIGDKGTESGTANNITLTFKDKITVTTGITDWVEGNNNNYDIDDSK